MSLYFLLVFNVFCQFVFAPNTEQNHRFFLDTAQCLGNAPLCGVCVSLVWLARRDEGIKQIAFQLAEKKTALSCTLYCVEFCGGRNEQNANQQIVHRTPSERRNDFCSELDLLGQGGS